MALAAAQRKDIQEPIYLAYRLASVPGRNRPGLYISLLPERVLRRGVDIVRSEEYVSWLEVPMGDTIVVEKCKSLQGLLEDALRHPKRIADLHSSPARLKLGQLFDHGIHTWTHGLKYQALVYAIGAAVFELA